MVLHSVVGLPPWLSSKTLPAMQETWVRSLDGEDPLEEDPPSTPLQKIPWTEEPGRLEFIGLQRVGHD